MKDPLHNVLGQFMFQTLVELKSTPWLLGNPTYANQIFRLALPENQVRNFDIGRLEELLFIVTYQYKYEYAGLGNI